MTRSMRPSRAESLGPRTGALGVALVLALSVSCLLACSGRAVAAAFGVPPSMPRGDSRALLAIQQAALTDPDGAVGDYFGCAVTPTATRPWSALATRPSTATPTPAGASSVRGTR